MYITVTKKHMSLLRDLMRKSDICVRLHADTGISYDDLAYQICDNYLIKAIKSGKVLDILEADKDSSINSLVV